MKKVKRSFGVCNNRTLIVLFFLLAVACNPAKYRNTASAALTVHTLRCEYINNPVGVERSAPLLSWQLSATSGNTMQTAYEILVASSSERLDSNIADLWNSGKIISGQSVHVSYKGVPLGSRQQCFWKIKVWDNHGHVSNYSKVNNWEMGLLAASDWKGKWISRSVSKDAIPAPLFRKEIALEKKTIRKARAYISGIGYYELYINGRKVGDHLLDPGVTRYDKRVLYVCYDVMSHLQTGKNAIAVILGNGWYNLHTRAAWDFDKAPWRNAPALLCQIEITYADGTTTTLPSDKNWKTSTGAIIFDGIQNGETYDSRLDKKRWNDTGYNDVDWNQPIEVKGPAGALHAQLMPPIKKMNTIQARRITQPKPGTWLVDFGKGMSGRIRLSVKGEAGSTIVIKYGEKLNPDGTLDQRELARFIRTGDTQTDRYILSGNDLEEWSPRFVYHGFQYVSITGFPGEMTKQNIVAEEIHTALETTGSFASSDSRLNELNEAMRRSFLSNYHSYPTDCPHREKIGWAGDAQLVAETGLFNFNMTSAYRKWLDDFTDEQRENGQIPGIIPSSGWGYTYGNDTATRPRGYGPQWEGAYVTIPWYLYLYTGDTTVLHHYYTGLKRYIDYLATHARDYLLHFGIDDHKSLTTPTSPPIIATGFFYQLTTILQKIAIVTGHEKDAVQYASLAQKIKQAYNNNFYDVTKHSYGNGGQTSLSLALYQGLVNENDKANVTRKLLQTMQNNGWHFDAGVLGVKAITNTLVENGSAEQLYALITNDSFPSFVNWLQKGATTLWQDWMGERSLNHIMFGSFTDFFNKGLAGINADPQQPGYKHIVLKPQFVKNLQWVKASHHSPFGWIKSEWKRKGNTIVYTCTVPVNTTATLEWPVNVHNTGNANNVNLGSGDHVIEVKLKD